MNIETSNVPFQESLLRKKIKAKHGLISSCGIWINKEKQIKSVSIFKIYIGNTDRTPTLPNYKTL